MLLRSEERKVKRSGENTQTEFLSLLKKHPKLGLETLTKRNTSFRLTWPLDNSTSWSANELVWGQKTLCFSLSIMWSHRPPPPWAACIRSIMKRIRFFTSHIRMSLYMDPKMHKWITTTTTTPKQNYMWWKRCFYSTGWMKQKHRCFSLYLINSNGNSWI